MERRQKSEPTVYPSGSVGDLVARYRKSDEFTRLSEGTQSNYEVTMRRFEAHDTWAWWQSAISLPSPCRPRATR